MKGGFPGKATGSSASAPVVGWGRPPCSSGSEVAAFAVALIFVLVGCDAAKPSLGRVQLEANGRTWELRIDRMVTRPPSVIELVATQGKARAAIVIGKPDTSGRRECQFHLYDVFAPGTLYAGWSILRTCSFAVDVDDGTRLTGRIRGQGTGVTFPPGDGGSDLAEPLGVTFDGQLELRRDAGS